MKKVKSHFASILVNCFAKMFHYAVVIAGITLLSGCVESGVLAPRGEIAATELKLLIFSILLMLIVIIPVIIMAFWFARRYRAGGNAPYRPEWTHSTWLEIVWWSIPCAIILTLGTVTWYTTHSLDPYKPLVSDQKPVRIQVVALDWKWLFIYPDYRVAVMNEITIPTGKPIDFELTAAAPMNSFVIPQLGGQVYAMTGMTTALHLIANEPGVYRGFSANYTGKGFAEMQFNAHAVSEEEFAGWIRSAQQSKDVLNWDLFWNELAKPSISDPVKYFGKVDNSLFDDIVMSYMMPNYKPGMMQSHEAAMNVHQPSHQEG